MTWVVATAAALVIVGAAWAGGLNVGRTLIILFAPLLMGLLAHVSDLSRELSRTRAALELGELPFLVIGAGSRIETCNEAFARLAGKAHSELQGAVVREVLPREWTLAQERQCAAVLAGGEAPPEQVWLERAGLPPVLLALRSRVLARRGSSADILLICEDCSHLADFSREQVEAMALGRRFMQSLIDVIPHPVFVRDAAGRYLMANEAHARALGLPLHEVLGQSAEALVPAPVHALDAEEDRAVLAGYILSREQHAELSPGAPWRDMLVSKGACEGDNGERVIVGACFDLSHWRDAERELQRALEREQARGARAHAYVQRLIDMIPQPVYVKDAQSRYLLVNDAFCRERRRSREDLVGYTSYGFAPDQTLAQCISDEDQRVLAGETISKEECLPHIYTGEERFRLISKGACLDAEGKPVIVGANFDVTPWRQAERAVVRTRDFLQRMFDAMPNPVLIKDEHLRYVMVNRAALALIPGRDDFVGMRLVDLIGADLATPIEAQERVLLDQPDGSGGQGELVFDARDGKPEVRFISHKVVGRDALGQRVLLTTLTDVSELHRAQARLQEAFERETFRRERTQDFIQRLIDTIPEPVYVKDAESRYLMVNDAFARDFNMSKADISGMDSISRVGADDPEIGNAVRREDLEVLAGLQVRKEDHRPWLLTGKERHRFVSKGACLDADGNPVIVVASFDVTRWHQAERALNEALEREVARRERTQAFIQRLIDLIPQPVYVKDAQSRFMMVNDAQIKEMGVPRESVIGLESYSWVKEYDPALVQLVLQEDAAALAGEVILKEEHRPNSATGEERHRLVSKGSCLDADGNPVVVVANFNITRWLQAERELTEALEREQQNHERTQQYIQRLIDVIPYPVYVKDAQSRFLLVNDAFVQERGVSKDELAGRKSVDLCLNGEEGAALSLGEDRDVLAGGPMVLKEEHKPHPVTGEDRYRVISKAGCTDAAGHTVIVVSVFDVTPWRLAERQLADALARETERRERIQQYVQRLIDVIPQPVYVKDAQSRYLLVNEAFARDRGLAREALIGEPSALRPETVRAVFAEDAEVLAGRTVLKEEFRPHPASGQLRYRVIAKGSCLDDEGHPVIVGANFDVTPWRLAEIRLSAAKDEAERANAAKSLFLTNMSHELRTPMHGILSFARLGVERSEKASPERLKGYFERILGSGERLMGLLDDLLDLAKLESGRMEISLSLQDVGLVVQQVIDEFEALAATSSIRIDLKRCEPAWANIDAKLFAQIVRNLLSNALKFSAHGSEINVQLDHAEIEMTSEGMRREGAFPALELRVLDHGPGIPEDELESVFTKFVQSSHTRSGAGGTGLGLAICREIVSAHHGLIYAHNRFGGGAEFIVRFPTQ